MNISRSTSVKSDCPAGRAVLIFSVLSILLISSTGCEEESNKEYPFNEAGAPGPCDPGPCLEANKTVCTVEKGEVKCLCDPGYEDIDGVCELPTTVVGCEANTCTEKGKTTCVVNAGTATCVCDEGWNDDGTVKCVLATEEGPGDAILLVETRKVTRDGDIWILAAPGASANVIFGTDDLRTHFTTTTNQCLVYEGVSQWTSVKGPDSLTLSSSLQTATATWASDRYTITGLTSSAVFDTTDSLTVTAHGVDPVVVQAPAPMESLDSLVGNLAGWGTILTIPDGAFGALYIYVSGESPQGETGVMRLVNTEDLPLAGSTRSTTLLDKLTWDQFTAKGIPPQTVWIALLNQQWTDALWPGARKVPVQAGRMFQFAAADLGFPIPAEDCKAAGASCSDTDTCEGFECECNSPGCAAGELEVTMTCENSTCPTEADATFTCSSICIFCNGMQAVTALGCL